MPYIVQCPGSTAKMGDIDVTILAVLIRGPLVQYEVSWTVNGDRETAWIESFEITSGSKTIEVGFE